MKNKLDDLRHYLEEIAFWNEKLQEEAEKDHAVALIEWRGCVADAMAALKVLEEIEQCQI